MNHLEPLVHERRIPHQEGLIPSQSRFDIDLI
jgi:hypothetical protein